MPPEPPDSEHLRSDEVAAYVDHMLPIADATRIEEHLAECGACRQEVVQVHRMIASPPRQRRWTMLFPATAAIAAGVGAILLFRTAGDLSRVGEPVTRAPAAAIDANVLALPVHAPAGTVPPDSIVLAWGAAAPDAVYRISVSLEDGSPVWTGTTSDTVLLIPPDAQIRPGSTYFWSVDALLPDGRSTTTGIHQFITPEP